jgi:hypothetical protein
VPAPLPSAHDCRTPVSPLRVLSNPVLRRGSALSAPPCRACRGMCVRTRSVRFVRPCVRAPRECPSHHRARTLAARVHACESLVTFRVSVQVPWKVSAHCGTAGVPFAARARKGHACSTPSSTRVRYPLGRRPNAATASCAGVSAWHGPAHGHFTAQRDEPCTLCTTSQGFRQKLARRHDPGLAPGAQAAEFPVRPPRAMPRRAPARWCP